MHFVSTLVVHQNCMVGQGDHRHGQATLGAGGGEAMAGREARRLHPQGAGRLAAAGHQPLLHAHVRPALMDVVQLVLQRGTHGRRGGHVRPAGCGIGSQLGRPSCPDQVALGGQLCRACLNLRQQIMMTK